MVRISNEKKNLNRLAGEFLVASRFTQRGYMVSLQWGTTVGYDILVFDKSGNVAFIEVKTTFSYPKEWALQKKYANPRTDAIPEDRRFVACVDMTATYHEQHVYIFPVKVVAEGLKYYFNNSFPNSKTLNLSLEKKPQGHTKDPMAKAVGEHIEAKRYLENYEVVGIKNL
jgi:hypothetical protein